MRKAPELKGKNHFIQGLYPHDPARTGRTTGTVPAKKLVAFGTVGIENVGEAFGLRTRL